MNSTNNDEEVTSLLKQLSEVRSQRTREQKKISDLESQLSSLVRENNNLEEQLNVWQNKAQDVKNLQDELSTLEEVRYVDFYSKHFFYQGKTPFFSAFYNF